MRAVLGLFFIVIRKTCRVKCVCVQMLQCSKMVRYLLNLKEKASSVDLDHAASELCSKFHMNAGKLFPLGSDCILGIVAAKFIITTYKIICRDGDFESENFKTVIPRIDFLYDIIRYMRFVASITGPKESFHPSFLIFE